MSQQISSIAEHPPLHVIAITGCDGSGKSTLAVSLLDHLAAHQTTELVYLGQSSGHIGEWISRLPLVGTSFSRYLRAKSAHVHSRPATPPGNITTLAICLLSCWRAFKFRRMIAKSRQGCLLITDRYPQDEVAGFRFDGPQLAKTQGGNAWVRMLRRYEKKLYRWMASYPPLLLIRLDIDEQTAYERKPDHSIIALREKIAVIPHLMFNGAHIIDLDGRKPASEILQASLCAIKSSVSSSCD